MKYDEKEIMPAAALLGCVVEDLTLALSVGAAWVAAKKAEAVQLKAAEDLRAAMGMGNADVVEPAPELELTK